MRTENYLFIKTPVQVWTTATDSNALSQNRVTSQHRKFQLSKVYIAQLYITTCLAVLWHRMSQCWWKIISAKFHAIVAYAQWQKLARCRAAKCANRSSVTRSPCSTMISTQLCIRTNVVWGRLKSWHKLLASKCSSVFTSDIATCTALFWRSRSESCPAARCG